MLLRCQLPVQRQRLVSKVTLNFGRLQLRALGACRAIYADNNVFAQQSSLCGRLVAWCAVFCVVARECFPLWTREDL